HQVACRLLRNVRRDDRAALCARWLHDDGGQLALLTSPREAAKVAVGASNPEPFPEPSGRHSRTGRNHRNRRTIRERRGGDSNLDELSASVRSYARSLGILSAFGHFPLAQVPANAAICGHTWRPKGVHALCHHATAPARFGEVPATRASIAS